MRKNQMGSKLVLNTAFDLGDLANMGLDSVPPSAVTATSTPLTAVPMQTPHPTRGAVPFEYPSFKNSIAKTPDDVDAEEDFEVEIPETPVPKTPVNKAPPKAPAAETSKQDPNPTPVPEASTANKLRRWNTVPAKPISSDHRASFGS